MTRAGWACVLVALRSGREGDGMSSPQDPYGEQPGPPQGPPPEQQPRPYGAPPGPGQGWPGAGYPPLSQQSYQGDVAPKKGIEVERIMQSLAWVVLTLYVLEYLYGLTQTDEHTGDVGDRFFGGMATLGTGVFYAGLLLAVSVWLHTRQAGDCAPHR